MLGEALRKESIEQETGERPAFRVEEPFVSPVARPLLKETINEYEMIVARELAKGRNPELYWQQLQKEYDIRSDRRRDMVAADEIGFEAGKEAELTRLIRYEMNALLPRLAAYRVERDAGRFSTGENYLADLDRKLVHAEQTAESADGDETALRSAIENARVLRVQVSLVENLLKKQDGWKTLRAKVAQRDSGSILETLPPSALEPATWRDEVNQLYQEGAKLHFWQFKKRGELEVKIAALQRSQASEEKKARMLAQERAK